MASGPSHPRAVLDSSLFSFTIPADESAPQASKSRQIRTSYETNMNADDDHQSPSSSKTNDVGLARGSPPSGQAVSSPKAVANSSGVVESVQDGDTPKVQSPYAANRSSTIDASDVTKRSPSAQKQVTDINEDDPAVAGAASESSQDAGSLDASQHLSVPGKARSMPKAVLTGAKPNHNRRRQRSPSHDDMLYSQNKMKSKRRRSHKLPTDEAVNHDLEDDSMSQSKLHKPSLELDAANAANAAGDDMDRCVTTDEQGPVNTEQHAASSISLSAPAYAMPPSYPPRSVQDDIQANEAAPVEKGTWPEVNDQTSIEVTASNCHVESQPEVSGHTGRTKKGKRSATVNPIRAPSNMPLRRSARNDTVLRSAGNTDDFGSYWHLPEDHVGNGPANPPHVYNAPDTSYPQEAFDVTGPTKEWCTSTYEHVYYTRWNVQTLRADAQDLGASAARLEANDVAAYDHREEIAAAQDNRRDEIAAAQDAKIVALQQMLAMQGAKIDDLTNNVQSLVQIFGPVHACPDYLATQEGNVDGRGEGTSVLGANDGNVRASESH